MKEAGIFYGSSSGKTESVAEQICEKLGSSVSELHDVAETSLVEMMNYRNLILGIPTWGIGEMQDDWLQAIFVLEGLDLTGKTIALFGLGDQESYPDTFGDAMGRLYDILGNTGCRITGNWSTRGYDFERSAAVMGDEFVGLLLDEENQGELTELRINEWLKQLSFT